MPFYNCDDISTFFDIKLLKSRHQVFALIFLFRLLNSFIDFHVEFLPSPYTGGGLGVQTPPEIFKVGIYL